MSTGSGGIGDGGVTDELNSLSHLRLRQRRPDDGDPPPPPPAYEKHPGAYMAPPPTYEEHRQTNESDPQNQMRFAVGQRRSPESTRRAVQAVQPFGVRDVTEKIPIPADCQIVKQLAREAAVNGELSTTPDGSLTSGQISIITGDGPVPSLSDPQAVQSMIDKYQSVAGDSLLRSPKVGFSQSDLNRPSSSSIRSSHPPDSVKPSPIQVPQYQVPSASYSPASAYAAASVERMTTPRYLPSAPLPPPSYGTHSHLTDENRNFSDERLSQRLGSAASLVTSGYDSPGARATTKMMDVLGEENKKLRAEVENYMKKTFKLQQLELNYQRIHREYDDLMRRQQKRESLEAQYRAKLETELRRTTEYCRMLQEQLQQLQTEMQMQQMSIEEHDDVSMMRHEVTRLNMLLAQLMEQNKELLACKERQEIELDAQSTTLEEQRNHIQILDRALKNAQSKVVKLEEEREKKMQYMGRIEHLMRDLQLSNKDMQEREESHKRERALLEKELAQLQLQKAKDNHSLSSGGAAMKKANSNLGRPSVEPEEIISKLRRELEEKEEELFEYKKEKLEWEKRWCENERKKEVAMEEEDDSRNARVFQLEDAVEQMKQITEDARIEAEHNQGQIRDQKSKINGLVSKMQNLEARLAEKEAMINVLRKRGEKDPLAEDRVCIRDLDSLPTDTTKHRLAAARIRLLQSPSPSNPKRFPWHSKWPASHDASFVFDTGMAEYSSLDRPGKHYKDSDVSSLGSHRTQNSFDSCLLTKPKITGSYAKQTSTLPLKRHRARVSSTSQAEKKSNRSQSADDHLFLEAQIEHENEEETKGDNEQRDKEGEEKKKTSNEELWHV